MQSSMLHLLKFLELELYGSLTQISETVYKIVYIPTHLLVPYDFPPATRYSHLSSSLYSF